MNKEIPARFKFVILEFYPTGDLAAKFSLKMPFIRDEEALLKSFLMADLNALAQDIQNKLAKLLLDILRYNTIRTDWAIPELGHFTISLSVR